MTTLKIKIASPLLQGDEARGRQVCSEERAVERCGEICSRRDEREMPISPWGRMAADFIE